MAVIKCKMCGGDLNSRKESNVFETVKTEEDTAEFVVSIFQ